jgi:hypothetical protein
MLRLSLVVVYLMAGLVSATTAQAQVANSDFPGQLQPTLPANEDLVAQIAQALPGTDLNAVTDQAESALSVGTDLEQQLSQLLAIAPDDPARSRVDGVLTHVTASVDSLRLAQTETSLDSARARLDQARGEAQEALSELQPFVVGIPATVPTIGK